MSIETSTSGTLVIILVMAVVTLVSRWSGFFIMAFVPLGRRIQNLIGAMSGSVLIALLAPLALNGDNGARLALMTTAATILLLRKPLPAIAAGIVVAALFRHLFPLAI